MIRTMVFIKRDADDRYGATFDPATDVMLTDADRARLNVDFDNAAFRTEWVGKVLATGEHNGYDDSDFYALVWTGTGVAEIEYATTRSWTYANTATVDATADTWAEVKAWADGEAAKSRALRVWRDATEIRDGVMVEVVKGGKIPKGTVAEVVWRGEDRYRSGQWAVFYRVGLRIDGQRVFTAEDNVRRVGAADIPEPAWPHPRWSAMLQAAQSALAKKEVAA